MRTAATRWDGKRRGVSGFGTLIPIRAQAR